MAIHWDHRLTVQSVDDAYQRRRQPDPAPEKLEIRLQGRWLSEIGFQPGELVQVTGSWRRMTITAVKDQ